jgi:hypothetical protein
MIDRVETLEQTVARLGGGSQAKDPDAQPGDVVEQEDDDGDIAAAGDKNMSALADAMSTDADKTSPEGETEAAADTADGKQDVSAPSGDYLSNLSGQPAWAL